MNEFFRPKSIWIGKLCYARIKLDREAYGGRPDLMLPVKIVDIRQTTKGCRVEIVHANGDTGWLSADDLFDEIIGPTDFIRLGPEEPHREAPAAPSTEKPESKTDDPTLYDALRNLCHNFLEETRRNPNLWRNPFAFIEPIRDTVNKMLGEDTALLETYRKVESVLHNLVRTLRKQILDADKMPNTKLLNACRAAGSLIDSIIIDEKSREHGLWQGKGPRRVLRMLQEAIFDADKMPNIR